MERNQGRNHNQLRDISIEPNVNIHAEGSVLVSFGNTKVICNASLENNVPRWMKNSDKGWVTGEYGMLPRSTNERMSREAARGKQSGRTQEIQRLIGRSLRQAVNLKYLKGKTDISTTAEMAMEIGAGVCQDHVHAFIAVARLLGFSARYVSGYLLMQGSKIQDASHAWAEVHINELGWVGFDISNGISPNDCYVKLATGFDYSDVIPLSGVRFGNGKEQIVTRIMISQQ